MSTLAVAETNDEIQATLWVDALRDAGIRAASLGQGISPAMGGPVAMGLTTYRILVGDSDFADARNVITEMSGAGALVPYSGGESLGSGPRAAVLLVGGAFAAIAVGVLAITLLRTAF